MAETAVNNENKTDSQEGKAKVQAVDFEQKQAEISPTAESGIDILLDMDVDISVSIGEAVLPVRKLLQIGPGSVLELNKSIDSPADIFLNGKRFASGQIVAVNGRFGIRITDIAGQGDEEKAPEEDPAKAQQ